MCKPTQYLLTDIRDASFQIECGTRAEVLEHCRKRSAQLGERFLPFLYTMWFSQIDKCDRCQGRLVEKDEWREAHS